MRIAYVVLTLISLAAAACGGPVNCAPGEVPNDLLQACVVPKQCDGGVVNARNECVFDQSDTALDAGNVVADAGRAQNGASGMQAGRGGSSSMTTVPTNQTGHLGGAGGTSGMTAMPNDQSEPGGAGGTSGTQAVSGGAGDGPSGPSGTSGHTSANTGRAMAMPVCGNGRLEAGELCDGNCPTACTSSNACLAMTLSGDAQHCNAECKMTEIKACSSGDGCCPAGCTQVTDADCSASCGNGVLESGEVCDPPSSCPTSCDDGNPCTTDLMTGSAAQCSASCTHPPITAAKSGDGCCPAGANANSDSDCKATCGNGIPEPGETCDGNCPTSCGGGSGCMRQMLVGDVAKCTAACVPTQIIAAVSGDGCCPAGANANTDSDCPASCGNGTVEPGEACDPPSSCPSTCAPSGPCTTSMLIGSAASCTAACNSSTSQGCVPVDKYGVFQSTVLDSTTGLVWQRTLPATYAGCTGTYSGTNVAGDACSWVDAQNYCTGLGSGWRLPTETELQSIVETDRNPTINTTAFPNASADFYWTVTPYTDTTIPDFKTVVSFDDGSPHGWAGSLAARVRCVK